MLRVFVVAVVMCLSFASTVFACGGSLSGAKYDHAIDLQRPDNETFSRAVLHFVNIERCKNRRAALQLSPGLIYASKGHAEDMANRKYFSHYDKRRGLRKPSDRVRAAGVPSRITAENIAKNFVFVIFGRPISLRREGQCGLFYANGNRVPRHSYRSLAQELVSQLMASQGHRENILHRRFDRMGAGIGIDRNTNTCGEFYISQTFAGGR